LFELPTKNQLKTKQEISIEIGSSIVKPDGQITFSHLWVFKNTVFVFEVTCSIYLELEASDFIESIAKRHKLNYYYIIYYDPQQQQYSATVHSSKTTRVKNLLLQYSYSEIDQFIKDDHKLYKKKRNLLYYYVWRTIAAVSGIDFNAPPPQPVEIQNLLANALSGFFKELWETGTDEMKQELIDAIPEIDLDDNVEELDTNQKGLDAYGQPEEIQSLDFDMLLSKIEFDGFEDYDQFMERYLALHEQARKIADDFEKNFLPN
jgi:hypothetical protein